MDNEKTIKSTPKQSVESTPKKRGRAARKPEEANGIIVMYKHNAVVNTIEVDNIDQAKAVQATLNEWLGEEPRVKTKFIYL